MQYTDAVVLVVFFAFLGFECWLLLRPAAVKKRAEPEEDPNTYTSITTTGDRPAWRRNLYNSKFNKIRYL